MKKALLVFAFFIACYLGAEAAVSYNEQTQIITVVSTDRVMSGKGSKWLVLGTDENGNSVCLQNTDILVRRKFNSSDIQATIEVGKTYEAVVVGYRFPIISWYKNILSIKEIQENGVPVDER